MGWLEDRGGTEGDGGWIQGGFGGEVWTELDPRLLFLEADIAAVVEDKFTRVSALEGLSRG